jgi:hypothetical protein
MARRINLIASLVVLPGTAVLVGCASDAVIRSNAQRYATLHGSQRVESNGKVDFCRFVQPDIGQPLVRRCLTEDDVERAVWRSTSRGGGIAAVSNPS